jgi:hypothetical protein
MIGSTPDCTARISAHFHDVSEGPLGERRTFLTVAQRRKTLAAVNPARRQPEQTHSLGRGHAGQRPRQSSAALVVLSYRGRKVLLHLAPGTKEDTASCTAFFEDLKRPGPARSAPGGHRRGTRPDPHRGTCFRRAPRQRWLVHLLRNLGARDAVAGDRDPGPRLLRGGLAGAGHAAARRFRPRL